MQQVSALRGELLLDLDNRAFRLNDEPKLNIWDADFADRRASANALGAVRLHHFAQRSARRDPVHRRQDSSHRVRLR